MAESSLVKKLAIKPGMKVAFINAPPELWDLLGPLPQGVEAVSDPGGEPDSFDFVHLFVKNKAELSHLAPAALFALKHDGVLWISYPKKSAKVETDITRDTGWDVVWAIGLEGVSMVSINEVWSALRFRPGNLIKRKGSAGRRPG